MAPALLLALFSCKKEVLEPVFERGADVAIPQEGGEYSVPVRYASTKAAEYAGFEYRLIIGEVLGDVVAVSGKVDEIVFEIGANESYEVRTVRLAVNADNHWATVFSGIQAPWLT